LCLLPSKAPLSPPAQGCREFLKYPSALISGAFSLLIKKACQFLTDQRYENHFIGQLRRLFKICPRYLRQLFCFLKILLPIWLKAQGGLIIAPQGKTNYSPGSIKTAKRL
jgi:hypothetical protein